MSYPKSQLLFEEAKKRIPGGVNSPARAFKGVGGTPLFFTRAQGARLFDEDGNEFIDYVGSWGPMILGHAFPAVVQAVQRTAEGSTSFGAPTALENSMAERVCVMVPGLDKIRMTNSGTEACMSAVRVARGYTGRDKIIKFEGCYHGHGDSFLIKAGSGALTLGQPSSPGVTAGTAADTLTADYNDLESVTRLLDENSNEVAAVILEPVAGNMGCVPPAEDFLEGLRTLCDKHGTLLIFDEVMCGFRIAKGGAVERYGVQPDLVTYGKVIGAGMPVGAFGGSAEVMSVVAPDGPVYQAGTLSGNPVAMSAGLALLTHLDENPSIYDDLERQSAHLEDGLKEVFDAHGIKVVNQRVGSMLGFFFCDGPVKSFSDVSRTDTQLFSRFFHGMLREGVYLPPSAFESWFVSHCHDEAVIRKTVAAADRVIGRLVSGQGGSDH
ncbi:glutamate-1-semialdehyde 2,1-aminomutase [Balneolales bacterium ANBcel1]|nr:glutamate-1-semialdehyde 2,1-aminomutase [Balneolales bacterium ANBcel1]